MQDYDYEVDGLIRFGEVPRRNNGPKTTSSLVLAFDTFNALNKIEHDNEHENEYENKDDEAMRKHREFLQEIDDDLYWAQNAGLLELLEAFCGLLKWKNFKWIRFWKRRNQN